MKYWSLFCGSVAMLLNGCTTVYHLGPATRDAATAARASSEAAPLVVEQEAAPTQPSAALRVEARVGHETVRIDDNTYVMVELTAGEATGAEVDTSTALVLDVSGSMSGERIHHAALAARGWIERAHDGEVLALYTFNQDVRELLAPTVLSADTRSMMLSAVDQIDAAGGTCLSCGVVSGLTGIAHTGDDRVPRIVVLSDGRANVGETTVAGFSQIAASCREQGVSVTTVGLGLGYNEKVLVELASKSNGLHHFVYRSEHLAGVFDKEADSLRATVAAGVEVDIELASDVELVRVVGRAFHRNGDALVVPIGAISAGASRTVLLEVTAPDERGTQPLADVRVRFRDPSRSDKQVVARGMTVYVGDRRSELDALVAMRLQRSETAEAMKHASLLLEQGKKLEAEARLQRRIEALRMQAALLDKRARSRGDARAADISRDMQRQLRTTSQAKRNAVKHRPRGAVRSMAPRAASMDL